MPKNEAEQFRSKAKANIERMMADPATRPPDRILKSKEFQAGMASWGIDVEPEQNPPALRANTAKSAELQVMIWFLEVGWEVFTPVADTNATDLVVRVPTDNALVSVQIKHKQPGSKNEGQLLNPWHGSEPPFDYLVFYQPTKSRGLIIPKQKLKKEGKMFLFFKNDKDGYSTGEVRPLFREFAFDFAPVPHEQRARAFSDHFRNVHKSALLYTAPE